jgi:DNA-binding NarL/FixJ family response regulator
MRVLIVEDDDLKREGLLKVVIDKLGVVDVAQGTSFQSGLREVVQKVPDLILLDMSIPTFGHTRMESGGRVRPFGGYDFLFELDRREITTRVIVVTQFDSFGSGDEVQTLKEVSARMKIEFPELFVGAVFYQASESSWKRELSEFLAELGVGRNA